MKMYLYDFLKMFDRSLPAAVYLHDEEDPIWQGRLFDTPWWVAELELDYDNGYGSPIDYREKFENDEPGLVIYTKE